MLIKLLKHDFISLFKKISGLWLILGAAFAFQIIFADVLRMGGGDGVGNIIIMFFVMAGLSLAGFIISGYWFSSKMYGDEGYLTNTLPAKTWQVVLSKFIVATLITIISGIFSLIASVFMVSRMLNSFQGIIDVFMRILGDQWSRIFEEWFIKMGIELFITTLLFLSLILFSLALSNSIDRGNKTLKNILFFIILFVIFQSISNMLFHEPSSMAFNSMFGYVAGYKVINTQTILQWAYSGAWILFYFFGTLFISEKHLKLRD